MAVAMRPKHITMHRGRLAYKSECGISCVVAGWGNEGRRRRSVCTSAAGWCDFTPEYSSGRQRWERDCADV